MEYTLPTNRYVVIVLVQVLLTPNRNELQVSGAGDSWGVWDEWGVCNAKCGQGHFSRRRSCLTSNSQAGLNCPSNICESAECVDKRDCTDSSRENEFLEGQHSYARVGGDALLDCSYTSPGTASIRWERQECPRPGQFLGLYEYNHLDELATGPKTSKYSMELRSNNGVIIKNVKPESAGKYRCVDLDNNFRNSERLLSIAKTPTILNDTAKLDTLKMFTFHCISYAYIAKTAEPDPTLIWQLNGKILTHPRATIYTKVGIEGRTCMSSANKVLKSSLTYQFKSSENNQYLKCVLLKPDCTRWLAAEKHVRVFYGPTKLSISVDGKDVIDSDFVLDDDLTHSIVCKTDLVHSRADVNWVFTSGQQKAIEETVPECRCGSIFSRTLMITSNVSQDIECTARNPDLPNTELKLLFTVHVKSKVDDKPDESDDETDYLLDIIPPIAAALFVLMVAVLLCACKYHVKVRSSQILAQERGKGFSEESDQDPNFQVPVVSVVGQQTEQYGKDASSMVEGIDRPIKIPSKKTVTIVSAESVGDSTTSDAIIDPDALKKELMSRVRASRALIPKKRTKVKPILKTERSSSIPGSPVKSVVILDDEKETPSYITRVASPLSDTISTPTILKSTEAGITRTASPLSDTTKTPTALKSTEAGITRTVSPLSDTITTPTALKSTEAGMSTLSLSTTTKSTVKEDGSKLISLPSSTSDTEISLETTSRSSVKTEKTVESSETAGKSGRKTGDGTASEETRKKKIGTGVTTETEETSGGSKVDVKEAIETGEADRESKAATSVVTEGSSEAREVSGDNESSTTTTVSKVSGKSKDKSGKTSKKKSDKTSETEGDSSESKESVKGKGKSSKKGKERSDKTIETDGESSESKESVKVKGKSSETAKEMSEATSQTEGGTDSESETDVTDAETKKSVSEKEEREVGEKGAMAGAQDKDETSETGGETYDGSVYETESTDADTKKSVIEKKKTDTDAKISGDVHVKSEQSEGETTATGAESVEETESTATDSRKSVREKDKTGKETKKSGDEKKSAIVGALIRPGRVENETSETGGTSDVTDSGTETTEADVRKSVSGKDKTTAETKGLGDEREVTTASGLRKSETAETATTERGETSDEETESTETDTKTSVSGKDKTVLKLKGPDDERDVATASALTKSETAETATTEAGETSDEETVSTETDTKTSVSRKDKTVLKVKGPDDERNVSTASALTKSETAETATTETGETSDEESETTAADVKKSVREKSKTVAKENRPDDERDVATASALTKSETAETATTETGESTDEETVTTEADVKRAVSDKDKTVAKEKEPDDERDVATASALATSEKPETATTDTGETSDEGTESTVTDTKTSVSERLKTHAGPKEPDDGTTAALTKPIAKPEAKETLEETYEETESSTTYSKTVSPYIEEYPGFNDTLSAGQEAVLAAQRDEFGRLDSALDDVTARVRERRDSKLRQSFTDKSRTDSEATKSVDENADKTLRESLVEGETRDTGRKTDEESTEETETIDDETKTSVGTTGQTVPDAHEKDGFTPGAEGAVQGRILFPVISRGKGGSQSGIESPVTLSSVTELSERSELKSDMRLSPTSETQLSKPATDSEISTSTQKESEPKDSKAGIDVPMIDTSHTATEKVSDNIPSSKTSQVKPKDSTESEAKDNQLYPSHTSSGKSKASSKTKRDASSKPSETEGDASDEQSTMTQSVMSRQEAPDKIESETNDNQPEPQKSKSRRSERDRTESEIMGGLIVGRVLKDVEDSFNTLDTSQSERPLTDDEKESTRPDNAKSSGFDRSKESVGTPVESTAEKAKSKSIPSADDDGSAEGKTSPYISDADRKSASAVREHGDNLPRIDVEPILVGQDAKGAEFDRFDGALDDIAARVREKKDLKLKTTDLPPDNKSSESYTESITTEDKNAGKVISSTEAHASDEDMRTKSREEDVKGKDDDTEVQTDERGEAEEDNGSEEGAIGEGKVVKTSSKTSVTSRMSQTEKSSKQSLKHGVSSKKGSSVLKRDKSVIKSSSGRPSSKAKSSSGGDKIFSTRSADQVGEKVSRDISSSSSKKSSKVSKPPDETGSRKSNASVPSKEKIAKTKPDKVSVPDVSSKSASSKKSKDQFQIDGEKMSASGDTSKTDTSDANVPQSSKSSDEGTKPKLKSASSTGKVSKQGRSQGVGVAQSGDVNEERESRGAKDSDVIETKSKTESKSASSDKPKRPDTQPEDKYKRAKNLKSLGSETRDTESTSDAFASKDGLESQKEKAEDGDETSGRQFGSIDERDFGSMAAYVLPKVDQTDDQKVTKKQSIPPGYPKRVKDLDEPMAQHVKGTDGIVRPMLSKPLYSGEQLFEPEQPAKQEQAPTAKADERKRHISQLVGPKTKPPKVLQQWMKERDQKKEAREQIKGQERAKESDVKREARQLTKEGDQQVRVGEGTSEAAVPIVTTPSLVEQANEMAAIDKILQGRKEEHEQKQVKEVKIPDPGSPKSGSGGKKMVPKIPLKTPLKTPPKKSSITPQKAFPKTAPTTTPKASPKTAPTTVPTTTLEASPKTALTTAPTTTPKEPPKTHPPTPVKALPKKPQSQREASVIKDETKSKTPTTTKPTSIIDMMEKPLKPVGAATKSKGKVSEKVDKRVSNSPTSPATKDMTDLPAYYSRKDLIQQKADKIILKSKEDKQDNYLNYLRNKKGADKGFSKVIHVQQPGKMNKENEKTSEKEKRSPESPLKNVVSSQSTTIDLESPSKQINKTCSYVKPKRKEDIEKAKLKAKRDYDLERAEIVRQLLNKKAARQNKTRDIVEKHQQEIMEAIDKENTDADNILEKLKTGDQLEVTDKDESERRISEAVDMALAKERFREQARKRPNGFWKFLKNRKTSPWHEEEIFTPQNKEKKIKRNFDFIQRPQSLPVYGLASDEDDDSEYAKGMKNQRYGTRIFQYNLEAKREANRRSSTSSQSQLSRRSNNLSELREIASRVASEERSVQMKLCLLSMDRELMLEIREYSRPPRAVHDVMVATLLILGEDEKVTRIWDDCQKLCQTIKTMEYEGLFWRIMKFDVLYLHPMIASRALDILNQYTEEDILDVSIGATMFYVWTKTFCQESIEKAGEKPKPASKKKQAKIIQKVNEALEEANNEVATGYSWGRKHLEIDKQRRRGWKPLQTQKSLGSISEEKRQ